MTENKRFTMDNPNDWGFPITDNYTGKVYSCDSNELMKKLVKVINELNDENKQLKNDCSILVQSNQKYRKENEQLKKENYHLRCTIESNSQDDYINYLKKQNEQLKQELKIYRKVANCRNCDFQDYDCGEDGDVFEICDKGKDMENGICEDWKEFE